MQLYSIVYCYYAALLQAIIVPSNKSIEVSSGFHFTCEADGYQAELFKYQWKLNGTDIVNATSRTLTIRSADDSDHGTYQCIVTSDWNEVSTSPAQLTITSKIIVCACIALYLCSFISSHFNLAN